MNQDLVKVFFDEAFEPEASHMWIDIDGVPRHTTVSSRISTACDDALTVIQVFTSITGSPAAMAIVTVKQVN